MDCCVGRIDKSGLETNHLAGSHRSSSGGVVVSTKVPRLCRLRERDGGVRGGDML